MIINSFFYSIKQGIKNMWRNKMFSLASIATMSACIFLFGTCFAIVSNFTKMVKEAEKSVAVTVFFDEGISDDDIQKIGEKIEKRVEVSKVTYVTAEEAWDEVKESYFEGYEDLAEGFNDDNPLANSSHYEVFLSDVSMQGTLVTYIESIEGVRVVHQSEVAANTLSDFNRLIGYISIAIILILICVSVFLISNTVATGIRVRSEEIAIMKLIGASDWFIRAPFMVEGILIGALGSFLPLMILYMLYGKIITYIIDKFVFLSNMMSFIPTSEIFKTLTPTALLLGVGIGYVGSRLTIKKHLKV